MALALLFGCGLLYIGFKIINLLGNHQLHAMAEIKDAVVAGNTGVRDQLLAGHSQIIAATTDTVAQLRALNGHETKEQQELVEQTLLLEGIARRLNLDSDERKQQ